MFYHYHPISYQYLRTSELAAEHSTNLPPPQLNSNWRWNGDGWDHYTSIPRIYDPIGFKLRFTIYERMAIKLARSTDPVIDDLYTLLDDPRLSIVDCNLPAVQEGLMYLESQNLIAAGRAAEIIG